MVGASVSLMKILCTGDAFITPDAMVAALTSELGEGHEFVTSATNWPTDPFVFNDEVREFVGDEDILVDLVPGVDLWVNHVAPVTRKVLDAADSLRLLAVPRGGPTNVNVAALRERGVTMVNLPGRNAVAVAEYAVAVMVIGPRGIGYSTHAMRSGTWTGDLYRYDKAGRELAGSTVGLVGLGQIGHRVARLLRAYGTQVLAFDPYVDDDVFAESGAERITDLAELLGGCDIVSAHARITPETRGMFNADTFALMRPGTYFVNSARGELVDTDALVEALRSGHLSGAALDVFLPEPPPADHPLLSMPNVMAVSHLAGSSRQVAERAARMMAAEAGRFVRGEPLVNPF